MNKEWVSLLVILVLFFIIKALNLQFTPSNEITVYPISCSLDPKRSYAFTDNCKYPTAGQADKFKVYPDKQEVYMVGDPLGITKLDDCIVFDVKNWECNYFYKSAHFQMLKGNLNRYTTDPKTGQQIEDSVGTYYTDKNNWLWMKSEHNPVYYLLNLL